MTDTQRDTGWAIGDRVEYVDGNPDLIGACGTVTKFLTTTIGVRLDDGRSCSWFPWRLRRVEDDFLPSEYGLEVLLG